ncbi:MAG TPA: hypothetical protein DCO86_03765 [Spirochaetaceae bacterium]|nr:hypothetical protein [Spirochaetaceae bacterium]
MITDLSGVESFLSQGQDFAKDLSLLKQKRNYSLGSISAFLDMIGHPEKDMIVFHVAGSKGKGTISYILAALLESRFGSCGLFLSPFVYDFRERFTRPFFFFSDKSYIDAANELQEISFLHECEFEALSVFEKYCVYSLVLFRREGLKYAIFEVGLGGRYDATNALQTNYQFFATIEKEHVQILGSTLADIAREKSKIIKSCCTCFALNNNKIVDDVFRCEAESKSASIFFLDDMVRAFASHPTENGSKVFLTEADGDNFSYEIPLSGKAFVKDSLLAVSALEKLGMLGDDDSHRDEILKSLMRLRIPGRFERFERSGIHFVLDGAHTCKSIGNVSVAFSSIFSASKRILVFGCASDKNVLSMAKTLSSHFDVVIIQKPGDYKQSDINRIYDVFQILRNGQEHGFELFKCEDISETEDILHENARQGDACLVTGSFYLVDLFYKRFFQALAKTQCP